VGCRRGSRLAALAVAILLVAGALPPVGFVGSAVAGNAGGEIGDTPVVSASSPFAVVGGYATTVDVRLWGVPGKGLAAYTVVLSVENGAVASPTGATAGAQFDSVGHSVADGGRSIRLAAVDRNDSVVGGEGNVTLATVELALHADGDTGVSVDVDRLEDDDGDRIAAATVGEALTVRVGDASVPREGVADEGGGSGADESGGAVDDGDGSGSTVGENGRDADHEASGGVDGDGDGGGGTARPSESVGSDGGGDSEGGDRGRGGGGSAGGGPAGAPGVTVGRDGGLGVRSLAVDPTGVVVGESVAVDATVSNTDVIRHERRLTLTVDGEVVAATRVALGSGERRTVAFRYEPRTPGERTLSVGARNVRVAVAESPAGPDGPRSDDGTDRNGTGVRSSTVFPTPTPTPTGTADGTTEPPSVASAGRTGSATPTTPATPGTPADGESTEGTAPGFGVPAAVLALLALLALLGASVPGRE
jgi:hypothetical protein